MIWFTGNIQNAIAESRAKEAVFIVYIAGIDELSRQMDATWESEMVSELVNKHCVALRLQTNTEDCVMFSQIYPVVCAPCSYFIGLDGKPIDVIAGHHTPDAFVDSIRSTVQKHELSKQGTTAGGNASAGGAPVQQVAPSQGASKPASSTEAASAASSQTKEPSLTKEEKVERARSLIAIKQEQKAQESKQKEKNEELARRQLGKDVQKLQQAQKEQERLEAAQTWKREREEARIAREKVKEQIARDRAERKEAFEKERAARNAAVAERQRVTSEAQTVEKSRPDAAKRESARLQIRLPDGSSMTQTFPSSDRLISVVNFIRTAVNVSHFVLRQTYPRQEFTTADFDSTLLELNLAPSATLIVIPRSSMAPRRDVAASGDSSALGTLIMLLMTPFVLLGKLILAMVNSLRSAPPAATQAFPSQPAQRRDVEQAPGRDAALNRQSDLTNRNRREGNIRRLADTVDDDDDMATYNGNSTQQM